MYAHMHWFLDPIRYHYADFDGRATRREYWMFMLMVSPFALAFFFGVVAVFVAFMTGKTLSDAFTGLVLGVLGISILVLVVTIVPSIALQVRRLHDIGRSGWWALIGFVPHIGGLVLLVFYCISSEVGINKYGPNPYGIGNDTASLPPQEPTALKEVN